MYKLKANDHELGSFRDPSGFLFYRDGQLYRQVNSVYKRHYDRLLSSGLYDSLIDADLLVPHKEVKIQAAEPERAYKVIQPERIPFVSYPYEWSFSQLKDAALLTLAVQKRALEYDLSLKDCSAYNIQFRRGKTVFIDTLSFEAYREGEPWVAYRQFCQHFLAPLSLMCHNDVRLNLLLRVYMDGIPLDLTASLLPLRTLLDFGLLSHIHLHARSQRRFAATPVEVDGRSMSRLSFLGLIDSLERTVKKLKWKPRDTEWISYVDNTNYSAASLEHKERLVSAYLDNIKANLAWDLGANVGVFSRLSADRGIYTVSADVDPACVEVNYLRSVEEGHKQILPLVIDLTNPSPGIGWKNEERQSLIERGPADVVMALALLHHLAISNNLPFGKIADFFASICRWLFIEFIPKSDSQVQKLLQTREDIFSDYTQQAFEREFGRHFSIGESIELEESGRILYSMERKTSG
jgi:hypothetical protein